MHLRNLSDSEAMLALITQDYLRFKDQEEDKFTEFLRNKNIIDALLKSDVPLFQTSPITQLSLNDTGLFELIQMAIFKKEPIFRVTYDIERRHNVTFQNDISVDEQSVFPAPAPMPPPPPTPALPPPPVVEEPPVITETVVQPDTHEGIGQQVEKKREQKEKLCVCCGNVVKRHRCPHTNCAKPCKVEEKAIKKANRLKKTQSLDAVDKVSSAPVAEAEGQKLDSQMPQDPLKETAPHWNAFDYQDPKVDMLQQKQEIRIDAKDDLGVTLEQFHSHSQTFQILNEPLIFHTHKDNDLEDQQLQIAVQPQSFQRMEQQQQQQIVVQQPFSNDPKQKNNNPKIVEREDTEKMDIEIQIGIPVEHFPDNQLQSGMEEEHFQH